MTTKQLPPQPSLEQLRRQAKDLIRSFRAGEISAKERIASQIKKLAGEIESNRGHASLSSAQLTIAREYGFESWPKLKFFIESLGMTFEQKLKAFVQAATSNRLYYAKDLLQSEPKLATHDLSTACLVGDFSFVEKQVSQTPSLVSSKIGIRNWEPLLYVCFSYFHRENSETASNLIRIANLLIEKGADVNAYYIHDREEPGSDNKIPALYGPSGETNFPALAEVLLKAKANPDERESLYHSTEFRDRKCLELLLKYGADPKKWGALHHILDFDDLVGTEMLLKAGADPNFQYEGLGTALHHAIVRGRNGKIIKLLLQFEADINAKNPQGYTPYEMALRFGNAEAREALQEKVEQKPISPQEKFIAACAAADRGEAEHLLSQQPRLLKTLSERDLRLVADFAALNKVDSVKLMLDLGFDINQPGDWGGPVLHQAAWNGHVETVDMLINRGAAFETLNDYEGTALGTAIFATAHKKVPESDTAPYVSIAESLLEAGAKLHPYMLTMGNESMTEFLKTYSSTN